MNLNIFKGGAAMKDIYQKLIMKYGGPLIVTLILLLWVSLAFGSEVRVGAGFDVIHKPGTEFVVIKYGPAEAIIWSGNYGLGATYDVGPAVGWQAGFGGVYVADTDDKVGTHNNFLLRGGRCTRDWGCFSIRHISHGKKLGIARDRPNAGLNFVMWEYVL